MSLLGGVVRKLAQESMEAKRREADVGREAQLLWHGVFATSAWHPLAKAQTSKYIYGYTLPHQTSGSVVFCLLGTAENGRNTDSDIKFIV